MEETIIFSLIERAQFMRNEAIYQPRAVTDTFDETFLDYFLIETERVHSRMRRYTSPDEHAFFPDRIVAPSLPLLNFPVVVKPNKLNFNDKVKTLYTEKILPGICKQGDDGQYGSSAQADIITLQAISKRVHYGKFVAEAKFQEKPHLFAEYIRNKEYEQNSCHFSILVLSNELLFSTAAIEAALVNKAVENRLLERVHRKASTYGREISSVGFVPKPSAFYPTLSVLIWPMPLITELLKKRLPFSRSSQTPSYRFTETF
jgi:chorismate mutase